MEIQETEEPEEARKISVSHSKKKAQPSVLNFKKVSKATKSLAAGDFAGASKERPATKNSASNLAKQTTFHSKKSMSPRQQRVPSSPTKPSAVLERKTPRQSKSPRSPLLPTSSPKRQTMTTAIAAQSKVPVESPKPAKQAFKRVAAGSIENASTHAGSMPVKLKVRRAELRSIKATIAQDRDSFLRMLNSECVAKIDRCLADQ